MPNNNLRLRYALFLGAAAAVSAIPLDRREAEENSDSLNQTIEDAVHLDKDIQAEKNEVESDDESDDEDDDDDDSSRNDSRNRPPISSTISASLPTTTSTSTSTSTTAFADTLPSASTTTTTTTTPTALPNILPSPANTHNRNAAIAGGTIGGILVLALIAFLLYRFRKARPSPTVYPDEKSHPYTHPYPTAPPSTLFGGGSSQRTGAASVAPPPTMPKPPPLVFINPPAHSVDVGTFYRPETANPATTTGADPLPPVYEEMRSPGMESSISQTEPYPEKAAARKMYASFGPPPEPPVAQVSRFSWTTRRSSVDSEEPKFRSVNSWVSNQAGRDGVKEKLAQMGLKAPGEVPATPVEFRFHPGAPVQFGVGHGRMESADLDRQLQMNLGRRS
ncbi:uncharacterized protein LAJ45_11042 [Morchella importuna]|uniref:uncharacterized protein n=1 Tax=Morchella importuna TaxID=1174673 RepID=UPI001E8DF9C4|nr:uncharacterized protein LAJ45_11042 [Morchella importuna]KAH8144921.1 hypothetical protein LAJ45_11042 [Morchella importuna]